MARSSRGLPDNFALDLPDEKPTVIGDFLDDFLDRKHFHVASLFVERGPQILNGLIELSRRHQHGAANLPRA